MTPLALLWTGWCIVHSLLITASINIWINNKGGLVQGLHRILYILFALISLVPVLWYQYQLPFTCHGLLRYVRHPWYSGGIAFLWGLGSITDVNLVARSILSLYLIIGTLLEERKLIRELGPPYRHYCSRVPMLIPWRGKIEAKR